MVSLRSWDWAAVVMEASSRVCPVVLPVVDWQPTKRQKTRRQLQGRSSVSYHGLSPRLAVEDVDASAKPYPRLEVVSSTDCFDGFDCVVDNVTCCAAGLTQCLFPARHIPPDRVPPRIPCGSALVPLPHPVHLWALMRSREASNAIPGPD